MVIGIVLILYITLLEQYCQKIPEEGKDNEKERYGE